ncbi:MAG: MASE1 domain-containing protein [Pseudomonadota bacterium]
MAEPSDAHLRGRLPAAQTIAPWRCFAVCAAAYLVAALAGRLVALSAGYASPLWPAAGVALAALLVYGQRCWPGLWLGAFLVDLGLDLSLAGAAVAAVNAGGATLQALLGAALTRRLLDAPAPLTRERHVGRFLLLGGPLACLVSASISTTALLVFGKLAADQAASHWLVRWAGDALGVLLFAPLALLAWPGGRAPWPGAGARIALLLLVTAALLAAGNLGLARKEESLARRTAMARMEEAYDVGFLSLKAAAEALQGVEHFLTASREVTGEEFASYTAHIVRRPDLLSVDWAPRVPGTERAAFEGGAAPGDGPRRADSRAGPAGATGARGGTAGVFPRSLHRTFDRQ